MLKDIFKSDKVLPVQKGENILGYDKDNLADYRAMQEAEKVLEQATKKGFRKPSNKELEAAKQVVHEYRRNKAATFLEEHKKRITYFGVEIKAYFDLLDNGLMKPSLTIADFNPFKGIENTKPWSEAMEENLATRINCTHQPNEEETACKLCALNPENWGENKEGVTNEYLDKTREKIEAEKAKEKACERGEHVLNAEATEDANAPMQFCVNCRKPKDMWNEEAEEPKEA